MTIVSIADENPRVVRDSVVLTESLLFVCLFVYWNKTRKTILRLLRWEGSKFPGSDPTRAEAQTTCAPKTVVHTTYLSIYG